MTGSTPLCEYLPANTQLSRFAKNFQNWRHVKIGDYYGMQGKSVDASSAEIKSVTMKQSRRVLLGWRPLTERLGRKICEQHWRRHRDDQDSFDLFEEFGFRRPAGAPKPKVKKDIVSCASGRELEPKPVKGKVSGCRDCEQPREPGHRYCENCGNRRKAESNRKRQQRHYRDKKPNAFARPLSQAIS